ncbi:MAG: MFS transporter [Candidatus Lokiarchaeota archaeon]|nr:MFS transporter [Candidatus Lokiarchaeota archaeon]MBD3340383.1 MFS transporter [Candidatus Lokiarchaeota archaeon]
MSEIEEVRYSKSTHVSYGIGGFLDNFFIAAFTVRIIDFYENELLLGIIYVGIAFVIFGFWNMVNDPILGWLSDRKTRFTKRWGRRFPWFAIGALSYAWIYLLIFTVPFTDQIGMFIWLVIMICIFELLFSLWQINYLSLFPDKFRSDKERTSVGAWNTVWGLIGIVLGVMIPPLIITYGDISSYITAGIIVTLLGFILAIFSLPGMKEDEELKERQLKLLEKAETKESFWVIMKRAVTDKNFMAYVLTYMGHLVMTTMMLASLPYWNKYIVGSDNPDNEIIMSAGFLVAVLLSVPLWSYIGRKYGNRNAFLMGTLSTTLLFIPLFFVSDIISTTVVIGLIGVGIGAIWVLMYPCFSDVIDDIVIKTDKRQEGAYTGIRTFFGRFSIVIQALAFAIVHPLTGYIAGAPPGQNSQTPLAEFGIRILMAGFPMLFYFIGFLLIWRVYTLDQACVAENKELLQQKLL